MHNVFNVDDPSSIEIKFINQFNEGFNLDVIPLSVKPLKVYLNKDKPPSEEFNIPLTSSYLGGYGITIDKDSKYFCIGCTYYLLLDTFTDKEEIVVSLFERKDFEATDGMYPKFGVLNPQQVRCFEYSKQISQGDEIILSTTLFNGRMDLYVDKTKLKNYEDSVFFKALDIEEVNKFDVNFLKDSNSLFFCLKARESSSFMLQVIKEDDLEEHFKYNLLLNGISLISYQSALSLNRFRFVDFERNSNITFSLTPHKGDPRLYIHLCEDFYTCDYHSSMDITSLKGLISPEGTDRQQIDLNDKENKCHSTSQSDSNCEVSVLVKCMSDEECVYSLVGTQRQHSALLQERY